MPLEKENNKIGNLEFRIRDLEEKVINEQAKLRAVMNYLKIYLETKSKITEYMVNSCDSNKPSGVVSSGVVGRLG